MNDLKKMRRAITTLRPLGYEISMGEWCCNTCTVSTFATNKFAFWHEQNEDDLARGNIPVDKTFLIGWGEDGDMHEIGKAFEAQGLGVGYPEDTNKKIEIFHGPA